jgi:DNA-directed RNA polymerase subunit N (RpoN/RPB10)
MQGNAMRQPYYIQHCGKHTAHLYDDYGNRATKDMPRHFAEELLNQLNQKPRAFAAMERRQGYTA